MPPAKRYRVTNQRPEPVELHVAAEAVFLGTGEVVELATLTGQVEELARRGIVHVEHSAAPSRAPAAAKPAKKTPAKEIPAKKIPAKKTSAPNRTRRGGN